MGINYFTSNTGLRLICELERRYLIVMTRIVFKKQKRNISKTISFILLITLVWLKMDLHSNSILQRRILKKSSYRMTTLILTRGQCQCLQIILLNSLWIQEISRLKIKHMSIARTVKTSKRNSIWCQINNFIFILNKYQRKVLMRHLCPCKWYHKVKTGCSSRTQHKAVKCFYKNKLQNLVIATVI